MQFFCCCFFIYLFIYLFRLMLENLREYMELHKHGKHVQACAKYSDLYIDNFRMNMFDIFLIFSKTIDCQMNILANIPNLQTQTKGRVNLFNAERHCVAKMIYTNFVQIHNRHSKTYQKGYTKHGSFSAHCTETRLISVVDVHFSMIP